MYFITDNIYIHTSFSMDKNLDIVTDTLHFLYKNNFTVSEALLRNHQNRRYREITEGFLDLALIMTGVKILTVTVTVNVTI